MKQKHEKPKHTDRRKPSFAKRRDWKSEAVAQSFSAKKVLLESLQNSQESPCARVFF